MTSKSQGKVPLSRHPLFPAVVGLWFAALLGIGSLAVGPAVLESLARALRLDAVLPAAAQPLGFTTRMLLALALALGGGGFAYRIARRLGAAGEPGQSARFFGRRARSAPVEDVAYEPGLVAAPGTEDDNDDLARLAAARDVPSGRRRPLVIKDVDTAASVWSGLALPFVPEPTTMVRVRPTILNLAEFTANPASAPEPIASADEAPESLQSAEVLADAGEVEPAALAEAQDESEAPGADETPAAQEAAPAPVSFTPPAGDLAARRLREASLDTLDVGDLVNRFALALQSRREREIDAGTALTAAPAEPELPAAFTYIAEDPAEPVPNAATGLHINAAPIVPESLDDEPLDDGPFGDAPSADAEFDAAAFGEADLGPARPFDMPATLDEAGHETAEWFDPAAEAWAAEEGWAEDGEPDEEIEEVSLETLLPRKRRTGRPFDYNGPEFDISAEVARWALPEPEEEEGEDEDEIEDDDEAEGQPSRGFSSLLSMKPSIRNRAALGPPDGPFVRIDDEDEDDGEDDLAEPVVTFPGQAAAPARKTMLVPGAPDGATPEETEAALREALAALRKMSGAG